MFEDHWKKINTWVILSLTSDCLVLGESVTLYSFFMFRNFRLYLRHFVYYVILKSSGECQLFSFNWQWTWVCSDRSRLTFCGQQFQCQLSSQILRPLAMGLFSTWAAQNELGTSVSSYTGLRDTLLHFFPLHYLPHFLWLSEALFFNPLDRNLLIL